jgi:polysaccharide pyruvyl transferase CsaB
VIALCSGVPQSVLLCGYYGEHNLGDDALLQAVLGELPEAWTPVVTAFDQDQVRQLHGVETVQRRDLKAVLSCLRACDALVLGGGSLLQDSTSFKSLIYYASLITAARFQGKAVVLWAQGLGPLQRKRTRALVRLLLQMTTAVSWRDPESATLARRLGCDAEHAADAVWMLPQQQWLGRGGPIVVCWRPTPLLQGSDWSPYLQALDQLSAEADREVLWLPFHRNQDADLLEQFRRQGLMPERLSRRSRQLSASHPREAMAVFRSSGLVLAMRLHALILAALSGAPVSALSYDPKVKACADQLQSEALDLRQRGRTAEECLTLWRSSLDCPPASRVIASIRSTVELHRRILRAALCR